MSGGGYQPTSTPEKVYPSGFVYRWTNTLNGKVYVGSHVGTPEDGYIGSGTVFRKAVEKYGLDSFSREILVTLENFTLPELRAEEQHHLDELFVSEAATYNVRRIAGGGFEHVNSDPAHQTAAKQRLLQYGHLSSRNRGKSHTEETKAKQRAGATRWTRDNKARPIWCFTLAGELVKQFEAITDAATFVNGSLSNIKYTAEGKFTHAYGYLWSYTDNASALNDPTTIHGRKRIQTPDGAFDSVKAVTAHFGFKSTASVRRRCLSSDPKWSEWSYLT